MSTEAALPDYAFNLQQKEYLQGLFAGLASGGLRTFVGHLPDGRITNVPAPGLEKPRIYFRVELAGIPGHQQFTKDSVLLVKPNESVAVAAAIVRVFVE